MSQQYMHYTFFHNLGELTEFVNNNQLSRENVQIFYVNDTIAPDWVLPSLKQNYQLVYWDEHKELNDTERAIKDNAKQFEMESTNFQKEQAELFMKGMK